MGIVFINIISSYGIIMEDSSTYDDDDEDEVYKAMEVDTAVAGWFMMENPYENPVDSLVFWDGLGDFHGDVLCEDHDSQWLIVINSG